MLPELTTERLLLRERTLADLDACLAMDEDPETVRFVVGPWHDPIAHRAFVERRIRHPYPAGLGYWSVRSKGGGRFIGWILLIPVDLEGPEIEIGWRFVRTAWGRGFATEAARPVLCHGLGTLALDCVIADIDRRNGASIAVARKLGMRPLVGAAAGAAPAGHVRFAAARDEVPAAEGKADVTRRGRTRRPG